MWLTKLKSSPKWYARWEHPDGSGVVISRTTGEVGRRAAEARGKELEEAFLADWKRSQTGGNVLSDQVCAEWWESDGSKKKATDSSFPHLGRIQRHLANRPYCDVTIADVQRFIDSLESEGKYSPSTINRALSIWRRMHNVAFKVRRYPVQMIDWSLVWKMEPEGKDAALTGEHITAIFSHLPYHIGQIAAFALLTGVRKSQAAGLAWSRVDMAAGTAKIYRKHRKAYALATIKLHPVVMEILRERQRVAIDDTVFDSTNMRLHWEQARAKAGMPHVRFHDLRHAFASMIARRNPIKVVQQLLQHADIRTTMRYVHADGADIDSALASIPTLNLPSITMRQSPACNTPTTRDRTADDVQFDVQVAE